MQQHRPEIARVLVAPTRRVLHPVDRHLRVALAGPGGGVAVGIHVGVLTTRRHLGPPVDLRPVLLGDAHHLAQHLRRQERGDLVHELDLALVGGAVEDRATHPADRGLEPGDLTRLEQRRDVAPKRRMPQPLDYAKELKELDDEGRRRVLRDNALELTQRNPV